MLVVFAPFGTGVQACKERLFVIYFYYFAQVTDARDGQSRTIRQFQFIEWPEQVSFLQYS